MKSVLRSGNVIGWNRNRDHEGRRSGKTGALPPIHPGLSEEPMNLCRLFAFGLFLIVVAPAWANEDLPAEARKLLEEHEKASGEIVKKTEELLKKAQQAQQQAEEELIERKKKLIAQLEELGKRLEKEGKASQAEVVADQVEELKTGRIAGAAPAPGNVVSLRGQNGKVFYFEVTGADRRRLGHRRLYR